MTGRCVLEARLRGPGEGGAGGEGWETVRHEETGGVNAGNKRENKRRTEMRPRSRHTRPC